MPRRPGAVAALLAAACAPSSPGPARAPTAPQVPQAELDRQHVAAFVDAEARAIDWLAAADPRLAARLGAKAPREVLDRIGTEAVLAEDATAPIHDDALDLFAFRARALALDEAAKVLSGCSVSLPDVAGPDAGLARPRLERELLARMVEEERARATDEAKLGDSSGDLVRGILSTWQTPGGKDAWQERDGWVAKHLLEIQRSLQDGRPRTGPLDLDEALYPLERLLAPLQFPRGAVALARVRVALDEDMRANPAVASPERVARVTGAYLGVTLDAGAMRPRLEGIEARLRQRALAVLGAAGGRRPAVEARARELLFVEGRCPPPAGSRVRAAGPPPERAAVCGLLAALGEEASRDAAVVALHDDVLLSFSAVDRSPPPRTGLLCSPDNDRVDALRRGARERPAVALGLALAGEILSGDDADARTTAWLSLGDAPLDVVARETGSATATPR
jgi:hypothetical protein